MTLDTTPAPLSFDPRTGNTAPAPQESTIEDVDTAVTTASRVAQEIGTAPPSLRADWLRCVADALEEECVPLSELADAETALGLPRLRGELTRAAASLRFYAAVAAEGSWLDAVIDHATAEAPDLRRVNSPLGTVAVFGASNFPFGFGVLGHDTATALAAGCPVVVKAHPGHPRLSAALARTATDALVSAGAPSGALGIVAGFPAGEALVTHPLIRAVGFTGSQQGGMALQRLAFQRTVPIPVFAEMGTVNAVVLTRAAAGRANEIASGFVQSFTLGMGQFCTKPGILLAPSGASIAERVSDEMTKQGPSGWLLTEGIARAYNAGLERLEAAGAVRICEAAAKAEGGWSARPTVLRVAIDRLSEGSPLLEECFGPVAVIAEYEDEEQLAGALEALPASLAAAVHANGPEDAQLTELVTALARRAGRVVVDGWPTGVATTWAQHHGGPWPATSVTWATSVGARALLRFVRPVAYQNVPDAALPAPLQDSNPWMLPRRVDGRCA